jgi:uncharacterized protein YjbI with pentapeptide repeats
MSMAFLGKWTLAQGTGSVRIDMASGALSVGAPSGGSDRFNAYGTASAFVLQGANGLYVVASGTGYAATKQSTDPLNQFTLVDAGSGNVRVLDLGPGGTGPTQYYWNNVGGALQQIAKGDSPPATTVFTQTVVTVGLATILQEGFGTPQPDLTWVNLSGVDFTQARGRLDFTQTTMTHADMSKAKFQDGTSFDRSTGQYVNFSEATLNGCSIGGIDFTLANFTKAKMQQISAESSTFTDAVMNGADCKNALNLAYSKFIRSKLQGVDFSGTGNIYQTDFTGADLRGAVFTGALVTGTMTISGANLTGAALNNPGVVTIFPKMIVLDSATNFTRAQLQYMDFSGYTLDNMLFSEADMTGCKLHGAGLTNTEMAYATLDGVDLTGTVRMNGANLSNASLRGADLTNAQLGALSSLFSVGAGTPNYAPFLKALQSDDTATVINVFKANGYTLAGTVTITVSRFSSTTWTVQATAPTLAIYTVAQEKIGGAEALNVYTPTTPAVLANAFMVGVNLTGANMIGVNASGAAIYGTAGKKPNLNSALLQEAQFANANLGNADFSSAYLQGVCFDYAVLTNAIFQHAHLITAASGLRPSLIGANLQSANFDDTTLNNVIFTNAAFGVANPNNAQTPAGVWLFSLSQAQQTLVSGELQNASAHQFPLSLQSLQQLQTPGPVGKGIATQFKNAGITLTADAVLAIMSDAIYWQLTDGATKYVIFQSYDQVNSRPALGVAAGTDYTPNPQFTLPLSLQSHLNNGPVDAAVVAAFKAAGHPITTSAQLNVALHPTDWQIINGQPGYEIYSLWLDLSAGTTTITARPALTNVIAAFNNASIALSIRATASTIQSGGWMVNNDSENPYNPVKNYIIFNAIPNSRTKGLDVFGAFMRIERLKSPTESEFVNIPAGITQLTQTQMQAPGIVCPNGDFSTSNQKNNLPYDLWLRARVAPRPPFCVPDPMGLYYCPL